MTAEPRWLSKKALLLLHEESLARFGGASGLRDEGLLDSALARAQNLYAYHPDSAIASLAAAYAFGLAKNHAFVDGNKRIAFLGIGVFLAINGLELVADQVEAIQVIRAVAAGEMDEHGLSEWIDKNSSTARRVRASSSNR